jgi:hypothetical protein
VAINLVAFFAHNIDASVVITIRKSTDNFVGNDVLVATVTHRRCAMYSLFDQISTRYLRVIWTGVNPLGPVQNGEIVIGVANILIPADIAPQDIDAHAAQVRSETPLGEEHAFLMADCESHTLDFTFLGSEDQCYAARDDLWVASKFGTMPSVVIPNDEREAIYIGRFQERFKPRRRIEWKTPDANLYEWQVILREVPYSANVPESAPEDETLTVVGPDNQFLDARIAGVQSEFVGTNQTWRGIEISPSTIDQHHRFDSIAIKQWGTVDAWFLSNLATNNQAEIDFELFYVVGIGDEDDWDVAAISLGIQSWTPPDNDSVVEVLTWPGIGGMIPGEAFNLRLTTKGQVTPFNDSVLCLGLNLTL